MNLNAVKDNGEATQAVAKFGQPRPLATAPRPHLVMDFASLYKPLAENSVLPYVVLV
jgi:hypothetical protein